MSTISNRDVEKLYDKYNPNGITTGDFVQVSLGSQQYRARVVGMDLDIKNKKVFAHLKLMEQKNNLPTRVDCADCRKSPTPMYPGHHGQ